MTHSQLWYSILLCGPAPHNLSWFLVPARISSQKVVSAQTEGIANKQAHVKLNLPRQATLSGLWLTLSACLRTLIVKAFKWIFDRNLLHFHLLQNFIDMTMSIKWYPTLSFKGWIFTFSSLVRPYSTFRTRNIQSRRLSYWQCASLHCHLCGFATDGMKNKVGKWTFRIDSTSRPTHVFFYRCRLILPIYSVLLFWEGLPKYATSFFLWGEAVPVPILI